LLAILFLAAFLRLYKLNSVPPGPSLDEVSLGYNAYSILKTGADEYGTKFPLILRAYDDFRPAFYSYLVIPFVWVFGLTTVAVRLPSVILSVICVWLTYLLTLELFKNGKLALPTGGLKIVNSHKIAYLSAILLSVSPWHIYLSRLGHEVNLGLTLVAAGVYFFVKAIDTKSGKKWLSFSSVCFALSLNSYQSQKLIVPILIVSIAIIFYRQLIARLRQLILPVVLFSIIAIPILRVALSPEALIRFRGTSAFNYENNRLYQDGLTKLAIATGNRDWREIIYYNRRLVSLRIFLQNYFLHFSPQWLFTGGPMESHKVPNLGLLYWWELPFIIIGIISLMRSNLLRGYKLLLGVWLVSAPLPAAITTQAPHAMRSFTFLPVWQILGALGLVSCLRLLTLKMKKLAITVFSFLVTGSLVYFAYQYYFVFPKTQSQSFQTALYRAMQDLPGQKDKFTGIIVSNRDNLYQSYMFYLFTNRLDPTKYQQLGGSVSGGWAQTHRIGKLEFRPIIWSEDKDLRQTLFIGNPAEFPPNVPVRSQYSYLDGKVGVIEITNN